VEKSLVVVQKLNIELSYDSIVSQALTYMYMHVHKQKGEIHKCLTDEWINKSWYKHTIVEYDPAIKWN
jgi:hypothetical protein